MLGTGYQVDIDRYAFLPPELLAQVHRRDGYPVLGAGFESSVPGLHFVGAPAALSFGPLMRFVCGTWAAARGLTRGIVGREAPRSRLLVVGARPRALVTDAEERSALAGCRGLAAAGYEVSAVAHGRFAVGHWSRHSKRRISLPDPRLDGLDYVERLAEVLTEEPHDVLLPGSEASMLPISAHRELIDPLVGSSGLPEHDVVLRAVDKLLLPHEATLAGLAPPESTVGDTAEAAIGAARRVGFPVVIKPWRSFTELEGSLRQGRARLCAEEDEVVAAVAGTRRARWRCRSSWSRPGSSRVPASASGTIWSG